MFLRFFLFSSLVLNGVVDASTSNTGVDSIEAAARWGSSVEKAPSLDVVSLQDCEPLCRSIIDSLAGKERFALRTASGRFLAPTREVFLEELSNECKGKSGEGKLGGTCSPPVMSFPDKCSPPPLPRAWLEEHVKESAVRALSRIGKGDRRVIAAISDRLTAKDWATRVKAVNALSAVVVEKGDEGVIASISARLTDDAECWLVREAALRALPKVVKKGDKGVIAAISVRLADDHPHVINAALDALPKVAEKGEVSFLSDCGGVRSEIAEVSFLLRHTEWCVREVALRALLQLAEKGDGGMIASVSARLTDPGSSVRLYEKVIAAVSPLLTHRDTYLRTMALEALPQVVEKGDKGVIAAISARLTDADGRVRAAAGRALPQVVENGDK